MKYLILIFNILLISSSLADDRLCSVKTKTSQGFSYTYKLDEERSCLESSGCWISISSPEDLFSISVNKNPYVDLRYSQYIKNEVLLLPLPFAKEQTIEILAQDNNQKIQFPSRLCINVASYSSLRWMNALEWFKKSGVTLCSWYFLAIFSFFLMFSLWIRKSEIGFSILAYSIISIVYLISFSEYPRALLDPVLSSGAYHFPLRLIQDAMLVLVFFHFYRQSDKYNFISKLIWIYAIVISIYFIMATIGVTDYIYYERLIKITAPLVAAPMAICTYFSLITKERDEKIIMIPASFTLLVFQLNDLLTFWGIIDSYYTVKFYIPFVVGLCFFLYLRRINKQSQLYLLSNERSKVYEEFIHDVRSPISVLKVFTARLNIASEQKKILKHAISRIENMLSYIKSDQPIRLDQTVPTTSVLRLLTKEKKVEYPDLEIKLKLGTEVFSVGNRHNFERIISNILNNAFEAYQGKTSHPRIEVEEIVDERFALIRIRDYGAGIDSETLNKLLCEKVTSKAIGSGIGLTSAKSYLDSINGDVRILSKQGSGTTVELKFPISKAPEWYLDTLKSNNIQTSRALNIDHLKSIALSASVDMICIMDFDIGSGELSELVSMIKDFDNRFYFKTDIDITLELQEILDTSNNCYIIREVINTEFKDEDVDLILIDDDKFIRLAWEYNCRDTNKSIATFDTPEAFLKKSKTFKKNVQIYIDLNIHGNKTWEHIEEISALGFKNIYLATGEDIDEQTLPSSISGVSGKLPPLH
ncbi:MAG: hypothetical protein CME71_12895 [Halobacteriovorax sp.]|nr:hypothetical protein [Halobacteriovorax sp.]